MFQQQQLISSDAFDDDDDFLLMAPSPPAGDHLPFDHPIASILGFPFARLISCFSSANASCRNEGPSSSSSFTRRWFASLQRPFGKTHLLVHLLTICLTIRALYSIAAAAWAPSLGVIWLQATLLFTSSIFSFSIVAILRKIATFHRVNQYRVLDRFVKLRIAAHLDPNEIANARSWHTIAIATCLSAFCFYVWSIANSTEILFHSGYYNLLMDIHGKGDNNNNGTSSADLLGGQLMFLLISATSFADAALCGLVIGLHMFIADATFSTFTQFNQSLIEKIVTRQISREKELDAIMRRSDNLLRFVFFVRVKFTKLGWMAFLVAATMNLSVLVLFIQLDVEKVKNLLLFANKYTNNVLATFLLLSAASFLHTFLRTLKMENRFDYIQKLLALENSFPNPINPQTQRLARALLDRLELANSHQIGIHRLQLFFCLQFFLVFAIIGIINYELRQIVAFVLSIQSTLVIGLALWYRLTKLGKLFGAKRNEGK